MKRLLLCLPLLLLTLLPAKSQTPNVNTYQAVTVALPFTTLAAVTSTNLASGWTSTTYTTNVTITYTNTGTFVTNTVIATNTSTLYADFNAQGQKTVALQIALSASGSTTTNVDFTISRSVDGVSFDTSTCQTFSMALNGTTIAIGVTNIDMGGSGYGRICTVFNRDATRVLTNNGVVYGQYSRQIRN